MIVNVAFVNVGTDKELILALCPAHGRFIADFVCLLRRDLAGRERLPDLKEEGPRSAARPVSAWYWLFSSRNLAGADAGPWR